MPQESRIITTEYLRRIEVALNISAGHEDISPDIRLEAILQAIKGMSQRANHDLTECTSLLNDLQDFIEVLVIEDKAFADDPEAYDEGWAEWKDRYVRRPGKLRRKNAQ